jgi:ABC-type uncharacterized transport system substrate-binding protein
VVHVNNTPIVQELQRQTRSIPILFAGIVDPVETGVVASLSRPLGLAIPSSVLLRADEVIE